MANPPYFYNPTPPAVLSYDFSNPMGIFAQQPILSNPLLMPPFPLPAFTINPGNPPLSASLPPIPLNTSLTKVATVATPLLKPSKEELAKKLMPPPKAAPKRKANDEDETKEVAAQFKKSEKSEAEENDGRKKAIQTGKYVRTNNPNEPFEYWNPQGVIIIDHDGKNWSKWLASQASKKADAIDLTSDSIKPKKKQKVIVEELE